MLVGKIGRPMPQAGLEIILYIEPLELHIIKTGLTAYTRLKTQLGDYRWVEYKDSLHLLQYWEQHLRSLNKNYPHIVDRCEVTILDRIATINLDSFNGNSKYTIRSERTIYTDSSKTL